jgi:hypothetical protein
MQAIGHNDFTEMIMSPSGFNHKAGDDTLHSPSMVQYCIIERSHQTLFPRAVDASDPIQSE